MIELLLLIPAKSFNSEPNLINDLLSIIKLDKGDLTANEETRKLIQRSISLIYTLTTDADLCQLIRNSLPNDDVTALFDELAETSSDEHVRFTSALIGWALNKDNIANRKYSPEMIQTFVHYLNECEGNPLQQCNGLPLDSMITTLTGTDHLALTMMIVFSFSIRFR